MVTRSIVTSHPDVECDFCGRRLLRGEQPEVYLAGAHRRVVCELCAPRAADEGWLREGHEQALASEPDRPGRTRGLFRRRRARRGEPVSGELGTRRSAYDFMSPLLPSEPDPGAGRPGEQPAEELPAALVHQSGDPRVDINGAWPADPAVEDWHQGALAEQPGPQEHWPQAELSVPEPEPVVAGPTPEEIAAARAIEVFNASEHPKRVSGIARALGGPIVSVLPSPSGRERVQLTVAWEICWYRYEVDLSAPDPAALLIGEGMELEELPDAERVANAFADERGELAVG